MKRTITLITLASIFCFPMFGQKVDVDKLKAMQARSIGPSGMSGRITAIDAVATNPNVIYVGSASGGLWKTESGGLEWTPIFDDQLVASIGALDVYQANPDIIWVGTGEGNPRNSINSGYGVYRSIDGGKTWELKGLEKTRNIHRIIIDPTNPNTVYVGAIGSPWGPHPERGVYKTTDGGNTWKHILKDNESTGVGDMVMDPNNPNKLFVAMWEYRRWPWFLKSGGPGSGLFMTWDGGNNWKKLTDKEGLPKGELGRIGLAMSAADSKRVYALIECDKNALYRSDDGGFSWRMTTDQNVSNRPFYYHEIHADPNDPDRIYNLYSSVTKTENGGLSFENFLRGIHPDHHAWYIHPSNSNYLIDGNDGGLAISHDRGNTWRFVTNLPLGQFYHINYDMEIPYNVYGGLQDNGSWYGPGYVFAQGGIQYYHWQTMMGGDGFDVVPDSANSRYGYAMSQGGSLGRYDKLTGNTDGIRPIHPEGKDLRFNWNAAIAHDPFDKTTIYYGSQYLHKSTDRGDSWEIISPDLTTNDPEKQKQDSSGGLTYDVTGAENHCTIIVISPSLAKKGVIWVGTDDGNLQLTQDEGKNWTNLTGNIKGAPKNGWIPVIHTSNHDAGEAFVVMNNYRQNDFTPYLFHTKNYGKTWTRLADEAKVWGYCLSMVQDPVVPNLLFLGTEYGLYFSIDYGKNWNKWTNGYPTTSTMDLKIHPRENDLIIATFGRSVYILDDIRPLREIAQKGISILDKEVHAFTPPVGYDMNSTSRAGVYNAGDGYFNGQNKQTGAILTFWVKQPIKAQPRENQGDAPAVTPEQAQMMARMQAMGGGRGGGGRFGGGARGGQNREFEPVNIDLFNDQGKKINTLQAYPEAGLNRTTWNMTEQQETQRGQQAQEETQGFRGRSGGIRAFPGTYKAVFRYGNGKDSTLITIDNDPRIPYEMADLIERREFAQEFQKKSNLLTESSTSLNAAKAALDLIEKQIPRGRSDEIRELRDRTTAISDTLKSIMNELSPERPEATQRTSRGGQQGVQSMVQSALRGISSGSGPITGTQKTQVILAEAKMKALLDRVNQFFLESWPEYKSFVESSPLTPFTDRPFKKLGWEE